MADRGAITSTSGIGADIYLERTAEGYMATAWLPGWIRAEVVCKSRRIAIKAMRLVIANDYPRWLAQLVNRSPN